MLSFVTVKWHFLSLEKIKYFFSFIIAKSIINSKYIEKVILNFKKKSHLVLHLRNIIFNVDKHKVWSFKWTEKYNLKFRKKNKIHILDVLDYYIDPYIKISNIE